MSNMEGSLMVMKQSDDKPIVLSLFEGGMLAVQLDCEAFL